jgi:type I restriction enzyme S subunit
MTTAVAPSASHRPSDPTVSDALPDGWARARLADVTERVPNTDPTEQPDRVFGYVDISSVSNTQYRIEEPKRIRGADAPSRARRPIQPGDVLFSNVRTYLRNIAIVFDGLDAQVCSTGFTVLRPNGAINPQFLFRYVLTDQFVDRVTPEQTGTHYPATSDRVVLDQPIPIPPLDEQHRIVEAVEELLAQVNAARQRLAKVPAILKRFRQAVLAAACSGRLTEDWRNAIQGQGLSVADRIPIDDAPSHLPDIPDDWVWIRLPRLGELARGKSRHRPRNAPHLYGGPYPFIQTGDIARSGGRITGHQQSYSEAGLAQSRLWPPGTVAITIAANIADSAILTYPACFPDSVVGLIADPERCVPDYIEFFIRTARADLSQFAPATAQANINIAILSDVWVPLPPLIEQHEVVRRIGALLALADAVERRVVAATARAERLTQAVLARAFRGELVPTEAELARREGRSFEAAEVLLRRIAEPGAGKAAAAVTKRQRRRESPTSIVPRLL